MAVLSYKEAHKLIRIDAYFEIAEEYQKLTNETINNRWESISASYEGSGLDPVNERSEDIEMLRLFKYRMTLMMICCLCETWEQDLYNFLKEEHFIKSINNDYDQIKTMLNNAISIDLDTEPYKKIREMRKFVNSVKHGNGNSFGKLLNLLGNDILADSNLGIINEDRTEEIFKQRKYDDNVLTSITLNFDGKINEYHKAIVNFWENTFAELEKREEGIKNDEEINHKNC